jgi:hypothetical protein
MQKVNTNVRCWNCRYCDKESIKIDGEWKLTKTGYCLAEHSAVNGLNGFYKKVYIDTIQKDCFEFEPCV